MRVKIPLNNNDSFLYLHEGIGSPSKGEGDLSQKFFKENEFNHAMSIHLNNFLY